MTAAATAPHTSFDVKGWSLTRTVMDHRRLAVQRHGAVGIADTWRIISERRVGVRVGASCRRLRPDKTGL
ncbi:MAG: hypothetical protein JWL66_348 [Sphingomonadales bacterium]|nr:hypothetical protein [Sphingomonadales bacterium]